MTTSNEREHSRFGADAASGTRQNDVAPLAPR